MPCALSLALPSPPALTTRCFDLLCPALSSHAAVTLRRFPSSPVLLTSQGINAGKWPGRAGARVSDADSELRDLEADVLFQASVLEAEASMEQMGGGGSEKFPPQVRVSRCGGVMMCFGVVMCLVWSCAFAKQLDALLSTKYPPKSDTFSMIEHAFAALSP